MNKIQKLIFRGSSLPLVPVFVAAFLVSQANAVTINWSGSSLVGDGTADISNVGTLVEAHNVGEINAITAGGVLFDDLEPDPFGASFGGANAGGLTGDNDFDTILNFGNWDGSSTGTATHTVDGLVNGNSYLLQYFIVDTRACCAHRTVTANDGDGGTLTSIALGDGYAFTGTFTANGTSQVVMLEGGTSNSSPAGPGWMNAWQLRETAVVPIPAALPLFLTALAGLGLMARRKKQTA